MNSKLDIIKDFCEKYGYMDYYVSDIHLMLDDYNLVYEDIIEVQRDIEKYFHCTFKEDLNRFTNLQEIVDYIEGY